MMPSNVLGKGVAKTHQVTKITRNGRISLGEVMKVLGLKEGDYVQIYTADDGKTCLTKVKLEE